MDKLVTDLGELAQEQKEVKDIVKSEVKSIAKQSRAFRALQIVRKHVKEDSYNIIKRTADIIVGIIGTIFLVPIMLFVKIANLINGDHAPVMLKQNRIGKNGKEFTLYKIRSMVPNAEKVLEKLMKENPAIRKEYKKNKKLENDPRITPIGKFIRKTSLDEFGQFVNILKGEMTLVGPRPYLLGEKEDMGEYYNDVVACKPGLTGLWQVEGRYNIGFLNRCRLDRFYRKHRGIWFDTKIFIKTFLSVLISKGAK